MRAVAAFPSVQSIHPKRLLTGILGVHSQALTPVQDLPGPKNGVPYCKSYGSVGCTSMTIPSFRDAVPRDGAHRCALPQVLGESKICSDEIGCFGWPHAASAELLPVHAFESTHAFGAPVPNETG